MKRSWFQHTHCTTEEADTLIKRYNQRGVRAERSLNRDFLTWTVSAWLPEFNHIPKGKAVCRYLRPK